MLALSASVKQLPVSSFFPQSFFFLCVFSQLDLSMTTGQRKRHGEFLLSNRNSLPLMQSTPK